MTTTEAKATVIESKNLSIDDILSLNDAVIERVEVPEWNGHVFVKGLSSQEFQAFRNGAEKLPDGSISEDTIVPALVAKTLCDKDGKSICGQDRAMQLNEKSASAMLRIYKVAARLNGLDGSDLDERTENFDEAAN